MQINAGGGAQPRMYAAQRAGVASAPIASPSVEPGASTIQVNVNGTVQLQ